jgi:hypothetical protein
MHSNRENIERSASRANQVTADFEAAQRRAIYRRLAHPVRWWNLLAVRRWATGVAAGGVLMGSLFVYQQNREMRLAQERASDAKLAQEVAAMANDSGLSSMAPLEGLFE